MRNILLASATTALLAAPLPAFAQTADWTGPYFGGRLGYTQQPEDKNETVLFDTNLDGTFGDTVLTASGANAFSPGFCGGAAATATATNCRDRDGTEWAAHVGFDYQLGSALVAGVVAEYGRSTIEDSVTAFSTTPAFYTFTRRLRDHASIRARVGFATGNTLIYGTGGLAYGKLRNSFRTSNGVNSFTSATNDDAYGYKAGGGIEQRVAQNFSIGAQYLYTSLKDDGFAIRAAGTNIPVSNPFILRNANGTDFRRSDNRFTSHNVSVVASFRF
jgi:outer membrane immunogenic protein